MSAQRRHGQPLTIWTTTTTTDRRNNVVKLADPTSKIVTRGWVIPQRNSRAEVPGELGINVVRIGVAADLTGVTLWSRVEWRGLIWDVVATPAYHHGTRHTRHWSIDIRERPGG